MMIYYAHSRQIYGTHREEAERRMIGEILDGEVICPNRDLGELGSIEAYYAVIATCDVVVCSEHENEMVSWGTFCEVNYSRILKKPVFLLRGKYLYQVERCREVNPEDKLHYGEVLFQNNRIHFGL